MLSYKTYRLLRPVPDLNSRHITQSSKHHFIPEYTDITSLFTHDFQLHCILFQSAHVPILALNLPH